ncbi:MAG TPA: 4-hydroxythreonine-4-phosphate dehydrogenase PdxA [Ignavibacteriaceae bacterium]|nr:4-hydroxythreonine-4-phosphate dehydrogenase PdxA [Ignavibacteriaceae bacterium]
MNKFVFTCGDVNGIGPEIVVKTLNKIHSNKDDKFYFICPNDVFLNTIKKTKSHFKYQFSSNINYAETESITIVDIGKIIQKTGTPTKESGAVAYKAIQLAFDYTKRNFVDAIITSPISKTALKLAGINFPGHTEMLSSLSKTSDYAMTFLSSKMNAALMTIHEPIKHVPSLITSDTLQNKFDVVVKMLKEDLLIENPKVAVLGLNPHAGENGFIGREEEEIIIPLLRKIRYAKYFSGPFPPDAFFANRLYKKYNLTFGMYHDQVLIPFKLLNFGKGVNYTAGLPIIRTSPDHGTAYDIAGKNIADESSMLQAFYYAKKIVKNRRIFQNKLR